MLNFWALCQINLLSYGSRVLGFVHRDVVSMERVWSHVNKRHLSLCCHDTSNVRRIEWNAGCWSSFAETCALKVPLKVWMEISLEATDSNTQQSKNLNVVQAQSNSTSAPVIAGMNWHVLWPVPWTAQEEYPPEHIGLLNPEQRRGWGDSTRPGRDNWWQRFEHAANGRVSVTPPAPPSVSVCVRVCVLGSRSSSIISTLSTGLRLHRDRRLSNSECGVHLSELRGRDQTAPRKRYTKAAMFYSHYITGNMTQIVLSACD